MKNSILSTDLAGAYVPRWLLARCEVDAGAKLAYAWLAQQADGEGTVLVCLEGLAASLGVTEFQVACFTLQLKEFGLIRTRGEVRGSRHFLCTLHEPARVLASLQSRRPDRFSQPTMTSGHGAGSGTAPRVDVNGGSESGRPSRPLSVHGLETCLAYAKRCKEEGEEIDSVYALARYLHRTGTQDEMISVVLGLGRSDGSGGAVPQDNLPFRAKSLPDSPNEIQDETGIDQ